ncbi:hypothetical protein CAL26_22910 [Bordetella genomosp. 9]|uniref:PEGA domain-containing protein n=2 Tax=Bordetella genomosp. 9 TaxID=1416803 RepID=A0A261R5Y3_9BORD|nr:hypothetical protein CAL26_22910 [Bordetella genomosp. 9]
MATIGAGALIALLDPQSPPGGHGTALASRHGPGANAINGLGARGTNGTSIQAGSQARSYAGNASSSPEQSKWSAASDTSASEWADAAPRARPIPLASASDPLAVANASLDAAAPGHTIDAATDAPARKAGTIIDVVTADMSVPDAGVPMLLVAPARGAGQAAKADAPATARPASRIATKTPTNGASAKTVAPKATTAAATQPRTAQQVAAKSATPASADTKPLATTQAKSRSPVSVPIAVRPWGEILVDGESRGISPPMRRLTLAAGTYDITIRNNVGPDVHQRLTVGAGQGAAISHTFQ